MPARVFNHGVPPQRLRSFLVLFAVALTLPLLSIAVYAINRTTSLEEQEIKRRIKQVSNDLAGDVDREIERITVTLETLATSLHLSQGNFAAFHEQATRAVQRDNASVILIDRNFNQVINTRVPFGSVLPPTSEPSSAQRAFETMQRQVSNLFFGVISKQPVVNIIVPVTHEPKYALIMALNATRFEAILQSQNLDPQWITGITDNNGIILARSQRHADFVGKPLPKELLDQSRESKDAFRAVSVAGQHVWRVSTRSQVAGWLVSATVQEAVIDASRNRGLSFAAVLIGTALALGLILAYMFGSFMTRPLEFATAAAEDVGRGKVITPVQSPLVEANTLVAALSDASKELARRQDHAEFLMRELAHRAKNQLAVVKGIALQTSRQVPTVERFVEQFSQRIQGLAESQDVMVRQNWQGAWLSELVDAHLNMFGARQRAEVNGPPLFLNSNAVQNVGFALHELATNANKHGALKSPNGRVSVTWSGPDTDGRIRIVWEECGGPSVAPVNHRGFGSLVITNLVASALEGEAKLDFLPAGIRWHLDMPSSYILSSAPPSTGDS